MNRLFKQICDGENTVLISIVAVPTMSNTEFELSISFEESSGKLTIRKKVTSTDPTSVQAIYNSLSHIKLLALVKEIKSHLQKPIRGAQHYPQRRRYTERMQYAIGQAHTA